VRQFSTLKPEISRTQWITQSALFLALALVLPVSLHAFSNIGGRIFLPMHIPVLLAGFLIGPASGLVVGLLSPGLAHLITGMPPSYAVPLMSLELPLYGLVAGLTYRRLHLNIFISLIVAMIVGRLIVGVRAPRDSHSDVPDSSRGRCGSAPPNMTRRALPLNPHSLGEL